MFRATLLLLVLLFGCWGCGTTKSQRATEQLLVSDAVDRAIGEIDFAAIAGRTVYLDTQYLQPIKGIEFVNANYIVSAMRQQMVAAGCRLQDSRDNAEVVVEARVGALGTDSHDVIYGVPASSSLSTAASLVPNAPPIPIIPEISLAKRSDKIGAAKVSVFAYDRETRQAIWQSGIAVARSNAKDTWVLGAGPYQSGTIYNRARLLGREIDIPIPKDPVSSAVIARVTDTQPSPTTPEYARAIHFEKATSETEVATASHEEPVDENNEADEADEASASAEDEEQ